MEAQDCREIRLWKKKIARKAHVSTADSWTSERAQNLGSALQDPDEFKWAFCGG